MTDRHAELRKMIEHASTWAEKRFRKKGELSPMWHAVDADGRHYLMPAPPCDSKDLSVALVRAVFEASNIVRCVFIDEAWVLAKRAEKLTAEQAEAFKQQCLKHGVADHPDRQEVVIFSGEDELGFVMGTRPIIRKGNKATLGPLTYNMSGQSKSDLSEGQWEGRLIGMLPQRGRVQ